MFELKLEIGKEIEELIEKAKPKTQLKPQNPAQETQRNPVRPITSPSLFPEPSPRQSNSHPARGPVPSSRSLPAQFSARAPSAQRCHRSPAPRVTRLAAMPGPLVGAPFPPCRVFRSAAVPLTPGPPSSAPSSPPRHPRLCSARVAPRCPVGHLGLRRATRQPRTSSGSFSRARLISNRGTGSVSPAR